MAEVLVEKNDHMGDDDMAAIIAMFEGAGVAAAPTEPQNLLHAEWILVLQWVGDEATRLAFESAVTGVAAGLWKRYRSKKPPEDPPSFIHIYGPNGEILKRVEVDPPADEPEG